MDELFIPSLEFVDRVINDPAVRPTVEPGLHRLDARRAYDSSNNQLIAFEGGVALFMRMQAAEFEGHVFCLPGHRGARALIFGKAAVTWLFTGPMASRLFVPVPFGLPAARLYCRRLGLKPMGRDLFQEYFATEAVEWAG